MPIVIEDSILLLPLKWTLKIRCVSLCPFIICAKGVDQISLQHSMIRFRQQAEMWLVPFLIVYAWYAILRVFKHRNLRLAYYSIPFEAEAHRYKDDLTYLLFRPKQAWRQYK